MSAIAPDDQVRLWLDRYGDPHAVVADLLCDTHDPGRVAFTVIAPDLSSTDITFGELKDRSQRLATALSELGVGRGDRVPVLMGKRTELVVTLLALWRLGAVHVPLFTAFATGAIQMRIVSARARLVITEPSQRAKLDPIPGIDIVETGPALDRLMDSSEPLTESAGVGGDGVILQLYTSGTTGKPKGVPVPVRALAAFHCYMHYGLDVTEDDVFWNAADPGWAYGLYFGILGPLAAGRRNLLFDSRFTPESTAAVIRTFGVTNFAAAPTVYRALGTGGAARAIPLRRASSAGEPLTPDVTASATDTLGIEIRDHYGQTELGMTICNAWHPEVAYPLRPGSMGRPLPGFSAGIVAGQIAVDATDSPLMWFTGYHEDRIRTEKRFTSDGRWYLTGDTGRRDEQGAFYFTARDDDLILAAGYRIGPVEVESVLITHPAVLEVAVVGRPDPDMIRGEVVEAFVVLAAGAHAGADLAEELKRSVRESYSKHAYPRSIHFVDTLPKTPSGKIQRYLLRERT
ncbi:AMP-binding protein [Nocardia carnea]|uniref:AMP-binding protein n=1 Tax=Nocardia carnea TaxID=37328 RepID=UPI002453F85D|nr:AMP-binding protein [Nocardia carnea]